MVNVEILVSIAAGITVALVAALIQVWIYNYRQENRRQANLKAVKHQLENNKKTLEGIENDLGKNRILSDIDPSIFHNFLTGGHIDMEKDRMFVEKLQEHLDNIGKYRLALQRLNLYYADFTTVGTKKATDLEESIKGVISEFKDLVNDCITEVTILIKN